MEKLLRVFSRIQVVFYFFILTNCSRSDKVVIEGDLYFKLSRETVGSAEYKKIKNLIADSIKVWASNSLTSYEAWNTFDCKIDTLLCFNRRGDRLVTTELVRDTKSSNAKFDYLQVLYGAKISGQWYFFEGGTLPVKRTAIQSSIDPLSFEELHKVALETFYADYLKKNVSTNKWEINDSWFLGMENKSSSGNGYGSCGDCKSFEEYVFYLSRKNWKEKIMVK